MSFEGLVEQSKRVQLAPLMAGPPPEVSELLERNKIPVGLIKGWYPLPKMTSERGIKVEELHTSGLVDAYKLVKPFLGNRLLKGTLRTMDGLNGCLHQCDTCLADARLPSKMFSFESLDHLFSNQEFLDMLQPDSFRLGSSGDILNHPRGVEIVQMILDRTKSLDDQRMQKEKRHHEVKVYVNYRPAIEKQLDELVSIANANKERLRLVISLPLNKNGVVYRKFLEYLKGREKRVGYRYGGHGYRSKFYPTNREIVLANLALRRPYISINDVTSTDALDMRGRVLDEEILEDLVPETDRKDRGPLRAIAQRGLVKIYLNPDALWLMIYVTPYESHTERVFTPITPENVEFLSQLPYHPDFPTPPNWPGQTRPMMSVGEAIESMHLLRGSGKMMKENSIVK